MKLGSWKHGVAAVFLTAGLACAGSVDVAFVAPQTYTDARDMQLEVVENLQPLADYLQTLGKAHLPPSQSLHVDVLDVDLAGRLHTTWRWGVVRVVGGKLDWPRMVLRYRLEEQGQVVARGEEAISDMGYASHLGSDPGWGNLMAEKRMLRVWFRDRFIRH